MRGGFTLYITRVQENRAYLETRLIEVPWSNKNLEVSWEHLTSKLGPAQEETWTAIIKQRPGTEPDPGPEPVVAELVATLYDASLDAYLRHGWPATLAAFRQDRARRSSRFANSPRYFQPFLGAWRHDYLTVDLTYRNFPPFLAGPGLGGGFMPGMRGRGRTTFGLGNDMMMMREGASPAMELAAAAPAPMAAVADAVAPKALPPDAGPGAAESPDPGPDLGQVSARRNLQETAFFFPQLVSDSNGVVRLTFTMPEALTTWRFLGFAHDPELRSGTIEATTITSKDLMVQPNPPRFLREGDTLEFTAKVSNQSETTQTGRVRLTLNDASSGDSADALLGNTEPELSFEIPARESRSFSWRLHVPDGTGFLTYKAVAAAGNLSDGEEGHLPVLSRRVLLTESLPLPIRGPATREFRFEKLLESGNSDTLEHLGVTVQMVSNPAWYAVLALPYLMEFPHECSEQIFNRFYANSLARFIALSDPRIRQVFDQWHDTPALDSPLEQNQDLKAILIEETPWLRQAQTESQARRNVGLLFEDERLGDETDRALRKLVEMQLPDGAWPWFSGGPANDYITLYVATGFGRLRQLGLDIDIGPAAAAWERLDHWLAERHRRIQEGRNPEDHVPGPSEALYLYGRSFFLKDRPIAAEHEPALEFFLKQSRQHWLKTGHRQAQGHLALALNRWGGDANTAAARAILKSLLEYSVTDDELGRFWRDAEASWWWYRAPIETQALLIEAFGEITADPDTVEELKVWLLKQKQTQDWKTTKATADAVYALLLRGRDILASTRLVEISLGGFDVTPDAEAPDQKAAIIKPKAEVATPGLGFFEHRFSAADVRPQLGQITVRKLDEGVAWGSVHWQYLEDLSRVTSHTATPLTLAKTLYVRRHTDRGPVLEAVKGPISVGDELVTRLELRVDRDMEYLHLKDQRGSGTEPVNVLSGYRYQDGLAYYESTRDAASHFFIDYLPRGTYVFEYSTRVQHRGEYQSGIAEIQCLYAPEFNSHSASTSLRVQ